MYDTRVGDQAVFYGLLFDRIACLPAQWNMRRLPKKTIHMLESQELGNILDLQKYVILYSMAAVSSYGSMMLRLLVGLVVTFLIIAVLSSCGGSGSSYYLSLQKNMTENMKLISKTNTRTHKNI